MRAPAFGSGCVCCCWCCNHYYQHHQFASARRCGTHQLVRMPVAGDETVHVRATAFSKDCVAVVAGTVVGAVVAATVSAVAVPVVGLSLASQGCRKKSVFSSVSSVFCMQIFPRCSQLSPFRRLIPSETASSLFTYHSNREMSNGNRISSRRSKEAR